MHAYHIPGYRTPEHDASPDAPNAANAAPLMPVCDSCGGEGISDPWRAGEKAPPCHTCDGTGRLRVTHEGLPSIIRPGHLGADEQLPAYAWPGGYPVAYYPCDRNGDPAGIVLCPDCATADMHAMSEPDGDIGIPDNERFLRCENEGDSDHESNLHCDGCNAVIAYQTYCYECGEAVDCDEDNPIHLCPKTEPYDLWYMTSVPGTEWIKAGNIAYGPDEARVFARSLRERMGAAFVHYQPSRLDFPPVAEEE